HGFCNSLLQRYRHKTPMGHNYETLDGLTQLLFLFEHFDELIGSAENGLYLGRWMTCWKAIEGVRAYVNKITEELVDPQELLDSGDAFLRDIGRAYLAYRRALFRDNRVDFAHLQRLVHDYLLADPGVRDALTNQIKYVLVDEYQDTNYIQEQILLKLTEKTRNLCVVGDEDQSLYRFRGATVRNILEFPQRLPGCKIVMLTTNYRSHPAIIDRYDRWMSSADWANPNGTRFRYNKTIQADPMAKHPEYPAVFAISECDWRDEARSFADLILYLKDATIIEDYSQVALLLHSVRQDHSRPYIEALAERGIPAFCPRARAYFENEEIRALVACFALIFGWHGSGRGKVAGAVGRLALYVDNAIVDLAHRFPEPSPLGKALARWTAEIAGLKEGEALDVRPADYLYRLLALDPFRSAVKNENAARNLAIFSRLLNAFQTYYHYTVVTHRNRQILRLHLFNSFLRLLFDGGINEYEDPDQPFPKGYVQVMTIHQAKGLEFPVVVVGSLCAQLSSSRQIDRHLEPFYRRPGFEPENRIPTFDQMRLHYVAFSRAQRILVLTAHEPPTDLFTAIWQELPQWPHVEKDVLAAQRFRLRERIPAKRSYSITGDLKIYETCPRQYQFFREYDFARSRSADIAFGLLVHQTIEEIHRIALDGGLDMLDEPRIRMLFERTYGFLRMKDIRPIGNRAKAAAFEQVMNYFRQNQDEMRRVIQTEVDVSLEKDDYILTGKVDLLLGGDGKLELLDFKTSPKPINSPELITAYERQLCTYAHILEQRHGRRVHRLLLYWTSEPRKQDALMVLPCEPRRVVEAGRHFDQTVRRIQAGDFAVKTPPKPAICSECDLRLLCHAEGIIRRGPLIAAYA
ncbi:MAG: ATP-dependent DNA helicase, partial [Gemmataceae bacterium]